MAYTRNIYIPLVAIIVSMILYPTYAHQKLKHPPQNPNPNPPQDPNQNPPQEPQNPNQKPPENQPLKPTPFHDCYKGHFTSVYAFGDSYTDTGNAQHMGALTPSFSGHLSSPYGSTTFGKSSNRLCDGRLVLDFVTDALGLPILPPYQSAAANFTNGVNFAVAGATTLTTNILRKIIQTVFLWKKTPLGVWTQLEWFKKFHLEQICRGLDFFQCRAKLSTALFWVGEFGINDYALGVRSTISLRSIARSSNIYVIELVRTLIRSGAKNIVVQGLPPIGCLPIDVLPCPFKLRDRQGCSTLVNAAVLFHNQILQAKLEFLRKLFPDVTIIYADMWKAYFNIVNNPQKYQFQEVHKTCCGATGPTGDLNFNIQLLCGAAGTSVCTDPSKYINWDGIHTTEAMNYHMTDQLINNGCCYPAFDQLMKNKINV